MASAPRERRGRSAGPTGRSVEHRERKSAEMDALGTEPSRKEADYSQLRQQHKDLRRLYRGVTDKNLQLKDVTKQLTQELESMRTINNALEQELQACKDDLFKAQPSGTVPDSKVAQAYEDLHEHVSSWMEGEICRFDVNPQKDVRGPLPDLFHHGNNPAVKDFLSVHVISAGEYFVRCILHVLLHKLLFAEEILLLGLGKSETDLLRQVEQSLDNDSVDCWRSQTLTALSASTSFQRHRQHTHVYELGRVLDVLGMHFPIIKNRSESLESFSNKVFEPALKLANTIQTSTSIYRFSPDIDTDDIFDVRNVTLDNLAVVKMVDIGTGKTLKADSPVEADEKGQIGQQILLLAPALFRCDRGRKPFLLVKAVILVQLYKPLGRRRAVTGVDKQRQGGVSLT